MKLGPPEMSPPGGGSPTTNVEIGPPRYLTYAGRTDDLYMADLCRVVRFTISQRRLTEVLQAAGPGADCSQAPTRITGLAVDQRTGDVYVGIGNELRRVGADGKLAPFSAKDRHDTEPQPVVGLGAVLGNGEDWTGFDGAGNLYLASRTVHEGDGPPVRIRKVIAAAL